MAAGAGGSGGEWNCSGGGVVVEAMMDVEGEEFSEREMEVAAILAGLESTFPTRFDEEQQMRPEEMRSWGKRRRRTAPAAAAEEKKKTACVAAAAAGGGGDSSGDGGTSPVTPLAFPVDREDDAASEKKAMAHEEVRSDATCVQEQRGAVASLSHDENAHLVQIEELNARQQSSRITNDGLKKRQSKHKKRPLPQREESEDRKRRLQHGEGWPALGLDLNEPAAEEEAEPVTSSQWPHHRDQQKAAQAAAARRRRQLIRRAKAAASRTRRLG